jgi:ParB/RepB/Spo0J family partition protein
MRTLVRKPIGWFKPGSNVRTFFEAVELELLNASLRKGQKSPVTARPTGILLDGERRLRAALLGGVEELDVIVTDEDLTRSQIAEIQLVSALHAKSLTTFEQYVAFADWLQMNPDATARDLAIAIDRDPSVVSKILSLGKCRDEVVQAAKAGKVGLTHWHAISQMSPEEQLVALTMKGDGANRDDISRHRRKQQSDGKPAAKARWLRCSVPGYRASVTIQASSALGLTDFLDILVEVVKLARKAQSEGLDTKTFQSVCSDMAKAQVSHA